ncbi:MAG TPA: hypothetical protein VFU47_01355 [Armatimonadota bacterium]|nr:hypothetical protein [Armatimonadota bacterium]
MSGYNRERVLGQVVTRAVTSPVSLFLATTGLLLVASPVAWPLGVAALGAEAGWLWTRIRDPNLARQSGEELLRLRWRDLITRLEGLSSVLDRATAATLASIVEAQERLQGYAGAEALLLHHSRLELTSLLQHCLSLAEKRHRLQTHLSSCHSQEIQRQASQLQAKLEASRDMVTRQLYEQALDQKREELENYVRLEEAVQRIDGQLAVVQCTFDNILSRVVRMQAGETLAMAPDETSDPIFEELNQLNTRVAALEASLDETLSLRSVL